MVTRQSHVIDVEQPAAEKDQFCLWCNGRFLSFDTGITCLFGVRSGFSVSARAQLDYFV